MSITTKPSPAMFARKVPSGPAYRVFTVAGSDVKVGATVESIPLKGVDKAISALVVGEEGRGRRRGVLPCPPAPLVPCPDQGRRVWRDTSGTCSRCQAELPAAEAGEYYVTHPANGTVTGSLLVARVGTTQSGKPRLDRATAAADPAAAIVLFRTPMGFRVATSTPAPPRAGNARGTTASGRERAMCLQPVRSAARPPIAGADRASGSRRSPVRC